jgi:hypothetical protein
MCAARFAGFGGFFAFPAQHRQALAGASGWVNQETREKGRVLG